MAKRLPRRATTEDQRAEQQAPFDESRIGVVCTDDSGAIVEANDQFLRMLGYERSQLRGKKFSDIVHPHDRWMDLSILSQSRSGGGERDTYEERFLSATGQTVMTAVRASRIGVGPSRAGFVVMVADMEAEREAVRAVGEQDALLAQILVSAPMILFSYDRDGLITLFEARGEQALLVPDQLIGTAIWDLIPGQPDAIDHFRRGLAGQSGMVNLDLEGAHFNCQYRPIMGPSGEVLAVSGVAVDVSEQLANHNQSNFLATMSHELRTPLNIILGFAELLASDNREQLSERQRRYVGHIDTGGRQLLSLVNDILDLAKVKAGHMTLAEDNLDARTVLHVAAVQAGVVADSKGIEIVERPLAVIQLIADERRVHQILLNLLSNAIKFSSPGGSIELDAHLLDGMVQLSVSDSGVGIAEDQLRVIFDEYRQVHDEHGGGDGTGLGLSLSRQLAGLMGGTLTATSELGVGSRFVLALPAPPAPPEVAASPNRVRSRAGADR